MNKIFLIGNVTKDVETATTQSGVSYCKLTVAVNRGFGEKKETDFLNVTCWRGLADNCGKYVVKGQKISVVGTLTTRQYEDQNGNKRIAYDIVADEVEFLSKPQTENNEYKTIDDNEPLPF